MSVESLNQAAADRPRLDAIVRRDLYNLKMLRGFATGMAVLASLAFVYGMISGRPSETEISIWLVGGLATAGLLGEVIKLKERVIVLEDRLARSGLSMAGEQDR